MIYKRYSKSDPQTFPNFELRAWKILSPLKSLIDRGYGIVGVVGKNIKS